MDKKSEQKTPESKAQPGKRNANPPLGGKATWQEKLKPAELALPGAGTTSVSPVQRELSGSIAPTVGDPAVAMLGTPAGAAPSATPSGAAQPAGSAAATGGGEISVGEGGPEEASAAGETEERMDRAAPDHADADAAAEAAESPEGAVLTASTEGVPEFADAGTITAERDESYGSGAGSSEELSSPNGVRSPELDVSSPPGQSTLAADGAASPGAVLSSEPQIASESVSPETISVSSGETGLDPVEQHVALQSVAEGGGAELAASGGGGGAAIEEKAEPELPDVSSKPPEAGLAAAESLSPAKTAETLGGVSLAVNREAKEQAAQLALDPPAMERPAGSPLTKTGPTQTGGFEASSRRTVEKAKEGVARATPHPEPLPVSPPSPAARALEPQLASANDTPLGPNEAEAVKTSVRSLPTSDPALNADAGPAPRVSLQGDADPEAMQDQRSKLDRSIDGTHADGLRDSTQPMGEDRIYPAIPRETLRAQPATGAGAAIAGENVAGSAGPPGGGGPAEEAASIIAREQKGPEIHAAMAKARLQMAAEREKHTQKVADEHANNQRQITELERDNAAQQEAERDRTRTEVAVARGDWSKEQEAAVDKANEDAAREQQQGDEKVSHEEEQANDQAEQHIQTGNQEAEQHRRSAEQKAETKRQEAEQESDGVFGWVASKAKAFFESVKRGITEIFEAARRLVKDAIERAKKLAVAVIEKARQVIVATIRAVGKALIAIGDFVLAAFPALRDKWRAFIREKVDAAEATVNRLADALKDGVLKLLDLLAKALDAALGLLQKGLLAAVDSANAVVQGAIKAAKAVADALGVFMALVKDIAADPGGWLRNLGAAVMDGIRNHLWKALKAAVKNWFNSKIEEVIGIASFIWSILKKGGIEFAQVATMAWEGLKAAIPTALISVLLEKLVAMIVPAAGAVMAIIEGIQAAWGAVSRIIAAIGKFVAFLKAVKAGMAGPQFGEVLASAAVVVIDFAANWVLKKIRGPASKIGGKIKAIAQKIMQRLKRVVSRIRKALKRFGGKVSAKFKGIRDKFREWREKRRKKKEDPSQKKEQKEKAKEQRLDRAVTAIRPRLDAVLTRGVGKVWLITKLLFWRTRYRLGSLQLVGEQVQATGSGPKKVSDVKPAELGAMLEPILNAAEAEFLARYEVSRMAEDIDLPYKQNVPQHPEIEDILRYRRFRAGEEVPPAGYRMRTSTEASVQMKGQLSLTQAVIQLGGASKYPDIRRRIEEKGVTTIERPLRGLMTLERARMPGMLPAMDVAEALWRHDKATLGEVVGSLNPMGVGYSGVAADIEAGARTAPTGKEDLAKFETATAARRKSVGEIFLRLRQVLNSQRKDVLAKPGGAELSGLARAFEHWLGAQLRAQSTDKDKSAEVLRNKLIVFLTTFRQ